MTETTEEKVVRISKRVIEVLNSKGVYKMTWVFEPVWLARVIELVTNNNDFYVSSFYPKHVEFKSK